MIITLRRSNYQCLRHAGEGVAEVGAVTHLDLLYRAVAAEPELALPAAFIPELRERFKNLRFLKLISSRFKD